jgi:hypothetical protein
MDGQVMMAVSSVAWAGFAYPVLVGLVLLVLGLGLFEKYVEI